MDTIHIAWKSYKFSCTGGEHYSNCYATFVYKVLKAYTTVRYIFCHWLHWHWKQGYEKPFDNAYTTDC